MGSTCSIIKNKSVSDPDNLELDRAKGCIYGVFIGDAIGSYLKGILPTSPQDDLREEVLQAIKMEGGGSMKLGPGQGAYVTEINIALINALLKNECYDHVKGINTEVIKNSYLEWISTTPKFEIPNPKVLSFGNLQAESTAAEEVQTKTTIDNGP